jgi:hypothetical protein
VPLAGAAVGHLGNLTIQLERAKVIWWPTADPPVHHRVPLTVRKKL